MWYSTICRNVPLPQCHAAGSHPVDALLHDPESLAGRQCAEAARRGMAMVAEWILAAPIG